MYYDDEFVAIDLPGGADLEVAAWTPDVRLSLPSRTFDRGEGIPATVEQWYHPETHMVAFELRREPPDAVARALGAEASTPTAE